jgi:hypothetical protein
MYLICYSRVKPPRHRDPLVTNLEVSFPRPIAHSLPAAAPLVADLHDTITNVAGCILIHVCMAFVRWPATTRAGALMCLPWPRLSTCYSPFGLPPFAAAWQHIWTSRACRAARSTCLFWLFLVGVLSSFRTCTVRDMLVVVVEVECNSGTEWKHEKNHRRCRTLVLGCERRCRGWLHTLFLWCLGDLYACFGFL